MIGEGGRKTLGVYQRGGGEEDVRGLSEGRGGEEDVSLARLRMRGEPAPEGRGNRAEIESIEARCPETSARAGVPRETPHSAGGEGGPAERNSTPRWGGTCLEKRPTPLGGGCLDKLHTPLGWDLPRETQHSAGVGPA